MISIVLFDMIQLQWECLFTDTKPDQGNVLNSNAHKVHKYVPIIFHFQKHATSCLSNLRQC